MASRASWKCQLQGEGTWDRRGELNAAGLQKPPPVPPCPGDGCTHRGSCSAHPAATQHREPLSRCAGAMWQGPASGPHERGPGTSPAGTQLLPAPNKGHLTARTARRLCVQHGQGTRHRAATPTSPAALQGQHRDSTGTAQEHSPDPSTSSGAGCPRDQTPFPPAAQPAHQFSLLMWSPKPGVSMTVSFMRTPFSSISAMRRQQLCEAAPENSWRSGLGPPREEKCLYSFSQAEISPPGSSAPLLP